MHCESFPVISVFCTQPRKFSHSKVLPYTVLDIHIASCSYEVHEDIICIHTNGSLEDVALL